jgi:pyruvate-formate lyase
VGGMGRRNPREADLLALAAVDATRRVRGVVPNLSLRFYPGQDPVLYRKALDVVGEGNTHPILYNDEVNVPAVEKAFRVSRAAAEQYLPFGCGEYILDHHSVGPPNGTLNLAKVLDVTLHNGVDSTTGRREGLALGEFRGFKTFDELAGAYARQSEWYLDRLAAAQGIIYRETGREVCFLAISLLFDHCVRRGLPLLAGGAAHLGGTMESFGNITTADSLYAIKRLVYEERRFTPDELLGMLDADFAGYEEERLLLKSLPKFGNDDAGADGMAAWVHDQVCNGIRDRAKRGGMDSYLVVVINNSANTLFGRHTAASADGRKAGQPLSNANQPTAGNDRRGMACLLSSMAKLDPAIHAGAVHNVKCSPDLFTKHRQVLEGVLATYWQRGGTQAMFTVVSRGILEDALLHPEQYPHLLVRVGGFSSYFVKLEPDVQRDILNRTLH